jgi:predicted RNA binding protein YcfA (HicA-like mRNA interferase family)
MNEEDLDEMLRTTREINRHLTDKGWKLVRTSGGHDVWSHQKSNRHITVPRHKGDLKPGTARSIMNQSLAVVGEHCGCDAGHPETKPVPVIATIKRIVKTARERKNTK